jgi:hypothetical protein
LKLKKWGPFCDYLLIVVQITLELVCGRIFKKFGDVDKRSLKSFKQSLIGDSCRSSEVQNAHRNTTVKAGFMRFQMGIRDSIGK